MKKSLFSFLVCEKSYRLWEYCSETAIIGFVTSSSDPLKTYRLIFLNFIFFDQIWESKFHIWAKISQIWSLDPHIWSRNEHFTNSCYQSSDYHQRIPQTQLYPFLNNTQQGNSFFPNRWLKKVTFFIGNPLYLWNPCNFDVLSFRNAKRFFTSVKSLRKRESSIFRNC